MDNDTTTTPKNEGNNEQEQEQARVNRRQWFRLAKMGMSDFANEYATETAQWTPGMHRSIPKVVEARKTLMQVAAPIANLPEESQMWSECVALIADSFFYENRYAEALALYELVKEKLLTDKALMDSLRRYADAHFAAGMFKEAALLYREGIVKQVAEQLL